MRDLRSILATAALTVTLSLVGTAGIPGAFAQSFESSGKRNCTAGYKPCIRKGSDVDCYGGSGNGPRYTKPGVVYQVTGSDPYRLDADNDGKGCERR